MKIKMSEGWDYECICSKCHCLYFVDEDGNWRYMSAAEVEEREDCGSLNDIDDYICPNCIEEGEE